MREPLELLVHLHRSLTAAWQNARSHWRDAVAVEFERMFFEEIDRTTREFVAECERFEEVLARAESALRDVGNRR